MPKNVITVLALIAALFVAGCTSSGSRTAGYTGPSISSVSAKRSDARKDVRAASKELRKAKKELAALERQIEKDKRRVKRKRGSAKRKAEAAKRLKDSKRNLRRAKRAVRKAERTVAGAERRERRAIRAVADAKQRRKDAERRLALAEKKEKQALARREAERPDSSGRRSRLFSLSDPALKNVSEYKARVDGGFPISEIPVAKMSKNLFRQEVRYRTKEKPGTIVVDPRARYLYLVQSGGRAMRYGIGVGKAGFEWSGSAHIGWKQQWPKWTPPDEMIARRPDLARWSTKNGGMPGGPSNPLGARALYLMKDGKDTLYRLHGTPEWASIGTAASSGCIRLMNQDVIDLYQRVPNGTKVVVL